MHVRVDPVFEAPYEVGGVVDVAARVPARLKHPRHIVGAEVGLVAALVLVVDQVMEQCRDVALDFAVAPVVRCRPVRILPAPPGLVVGRSDVAGVVREPLAQGAGVRGCFVDVVGVAVRRVPNTAQLLVVERVRELVRGHPRNLVVVPVDDLVLAFLVHRAGRIVVVLVEILVLERHPATVLVEVVLDAPD